MKRFLVILAALMLTACTPLVTQHAGAPGASFQGPRIEADSVVSFDGARLGLTRWEAAGQPWAVVVAVQRVYLAPEEDSPTGLLSLEDLRRLRDRSPEA